MNEHNGTAIQCQNYVNITAINWVSWNWVVISGKRICFRATSILQASFITLQKFTAGYSYSWKF